MKRIFWNLCCAVAMLTGVLLFAPSVMAAPAAPTFSLPGGLYNAAQSVELAAADDCTIFYTTDCELPTSASMVYQGAIVVDYVSRIPTAFLSGTMAEPVPTTIRAIAVNAAGEVSPVAVQTYLVAPNATSIYDLPVLFLTYERDNLWGNINGIYQNPRYDHKVDTYAEYYNADGTLGWKRNLQTKVTGQWSKDYNKKSIRLYFSKNDYEKGEKQLQYDLYPDSYQTLTNRTTVKRFGKLTLRISDFEQTNLRDPLAQLIAKRTRVDTASSRPVALFLNGVFWGVYELREQYDNKYVEYHYGVSDDDVVAFSRESLIAPRTVVDPETGLSLTDKSDYEEGPARENTDGLLDEDYYRGLWDYICALVRGKDITDPRVYSELCQYVDIDNFIDYIACEVFVGNDDWPGNNIKYWRNIEETVNPAQPGADGKFRFQLHDLDLAFSSAGHDMMYNMTRSDHATRRPEWARAFLRVLLENDDFRHTFAQRTMVYLSTAFSADRVLGDLDTLVARLKSGKAHDVARWRLSAFDGQLSSLRSIVSARGGNVAWHVRNYLNSYHGDNATGTATLSVSVDTAHGYADVGGALILPEIYGNAASTFTTALLTNVPVRVCGVAQAGYVPIYTLNGTTYDGGNAADGSLTFTIPNGSGTFQLSIAFREGVAAEDVFTGEVRVMRAYNLAHLESAAPLDLMGRFSVSGWQKLYDTTVRVKDDARRDVVAINGRILTPLRTGSTTLIVTYGDEEFEVAVTTTGESRTLTAKDYEEVSASGEENYYYPASNAFNNSPFDRWSVSASGSAWVMGKLYAPQAVQSVDVMFRENLNYSARLETSVDGVTWTVAERVSETTMSYGDRVVGANLAIPRDASTITGKIVTYAVNRDAQYLRVYFQNRVGSCSSVNYIRAHVKRTGGAVLGEVSQTPNSRGLRIRAELYGAAKNPNAKIVAAAYDAEDCLVGVRSVVGLKEFSNTYSFQIAEATSVTDPYRVEVFLWDATDGLTPLL